MFNYLRIFSLISLITVMVIAVLGGISFRAIATSDLERLIENTTAGIARGYINTVWRDHRNTLVPLAEKDPSKLAGHPEVVRFAQETVNYFQPMPLLRVNIYSAKGMLLISANGAVSSRLAGNTASPDAGFASAQLTSPVAVSRTLENVRLQGDNNGTLVQTVVPITQPGAVRAEGTVEMLYDLREASAKINTFQMYGTGGVIIVFLMLLSILFFGARKADAIIARQYEANTELAQQAAAAQAENIQKSQFLANVSHELRTPLNAIIGFSDVLRSEVIADLKNSKYTDYISDIHSSGVHLLSLINDILDYSKAEAGKLELEVSEVNVTKLIQNCMRLVSNQANELQVTLTDALPREQIVMLTDSKKLRQIFLNLLSNAVKFTQSGGEVKVSVWQNITEGSFTFEVRDSGIGIAPKDISVALAPFGQVDNKLSRKYEGTGLGLPLTKKFVELMGGKFMLDSQVGVGTTITFILPRELKPHPGVIVKQLA